MTFLSAAMLAGVFAFNIPLIIHLLNKSKFKVVPWGAMHLLDTVVRKNTRRIRLEQLLLLLVRALIPVALALAMAGPVATSLRALAGNTPSGLVILLDASFSMQAGEAEQNRFELGRQEAMKLLRELPPGSTAAVLLVGRQVQALTDRPTTDLARLRQRLEQAEPGNTGAELLRAIGQGLEVAAGLPHARRDVVLVSDFQAVDWPMGSEAEVARLVGAYGEEAGAPVLSLIPVGGPVAENLAVMSIAWSQSALGVGRPVRLEVTVRNFGAQRSAPVRGSVRVGGEVRSAISFDAMDPGELRTSVSESVIVFDEGDVGEQLVEVLIDADPLWADNVLLEVAEVGGRIPVLLVDGGRAEGGGLTGADYLAELLQPFASGGGEAGMDWFIVRRVPADRWLQEDLSRYRVVIFSDVGAPTEAGVRRLVSWMGDGGGVLVVPGERMLRSMDAWQALQADDAVKLLPARVSSVADRRESDLPLASVLVESHTHPAMRLFNDPARGDLSVLRAWRWLELEPDFDADSPLASAARVVARFQHGRPFVVEREIGRGRVMLMAVSSDTSWSSMPLRRIYLPLMQQLTADLGARVSGVGSTALGDRLSVEAPVSLIGRQVEVRFVPLSAGGVAGGLAGGERLRVRVEDRGGRGVADLGRAEEPGVWMVSGEGGFSRVLTVNSPRTESDLRALEPERLDALAEAAAGGRFESGEGFLAVNRRSHGRELAMWFLVAVVALLFIEPWLAQRMMGRRRI